MTFGFTGWSIPGIPCRPRQRQCWWRSGLAIHDRVFALLPAILAFLASWLIHIAGLFTDNYELLVRHRGVNEHPELIDAINKGELSLAGLRWAIAVCLGLAALTGPYLLYVAGSPVIVIGLLGMVGSLIYSAGPFPFGKHGLSDLHFFIMFGIFAPAAAYYAQFAAHQQPASYWQILFYGMPMRAFVIGLPLGAIAVNILIIDDIRDREFDAAKGWRTGPTSLRHRVEPRRICSVDWLHLRHSVLVLASLGI